MDKCIGPTKMSSVDLDLTKVSKTLASSKTTSDAHVKETWQYQSQRRGDRPGSISVVEASTEGTSIVRIEGAKRLKQQDSDNSWDDIMPSGGGFFARSSSPEASQVPTATGPKQLKGTCRSLRRDRHRRSGRR